MGDLSDPSLHLAMGSLNRNNHRPTPERGEENRTAFYNFRRSTSLEASVEGPRTPSVAGSSFYEDESITTLKLELSKSLRSSVPEASSLRALRNSLGRTTDVVAVATATPEEPSRPKSGPRDYKLQMTLADPTIVPNSVVIAHFYRPHQESLPVVTEGDVLLLRQFQVVSLKGQGFGIQAGDASAWAVFESTDEEMLPQIKGPPMELSDDEVAYADGMRRWWGLLDDKFRASISKATRKAQLTASNKT